MDDAARANVEPNRLFRLIRYEKVDRLVAWIDPMKSGVVDQKFIAKVTRDVISPQPKRPFVSRISDRNAAVEIGVYELRSTGDVGIGIHVEDRPNPRFNANLQIPSPNDI